MSTMGIRRHTAWTALVVGVLFVGSAWAQLSPPRSPAVAEKAFRHPDLYIPNRLEPMERLPLRVAGVAKRQLEGMEVSVVGAFFDRRAGRWSTLMPAVQLLQTEVDPSTVRHRGQPSAPAVVDPGQLEDTAWAALENYLSRHADQLHIDVSELGPSKVTAHDDGDRIQIYAGRHVDGIPVRDSYLTAVISHGNLILLGVRNWGDINADLRAALREQAAVESVEVHLGEIQMNGLRKPAELILVPTAAERDPGQVEVGSGYRFRLAWVIAPRLPTEPGRWEALVDAHDGELLAFEDKLTYATTRSVVGGVYPISNDGATPDGVEQPGYPMPYTNVTHAGELYYTDGGGNHPVCVNGEVTTTLEGPHIRIDDLCGAISESSTGDIDLGSGVGIDCDVPDPGVSSPGNTHAARSAFYHLNRVAEVARGYLPNNLWLQEPLTAVVDIPDLGVPEYNCNAFWDETTVNFFTSGEAAPDLVCSNTGEIAGVLVHEWGHGLDDNDAVPTISNPGEGIADVYAALRLDNSCIARGFYLEDNLCGDNDPCTSCTGVRDIDWAMRQSGQPHDISWIDAECAPPFLGDVGPCGGDIYCESAVYSEAVWDLVHRDLQSPPFNMDLNTALEIGTRLTYLGAGAVGTWYNCVDSTGTGDGCNADGGYLNFLAVDDDNGNLADGTPHMEAIFNAFDRHGIACSTPTVQNSGCAGAPSTAPVVTATPLDRGVALSWSTVTGAEKYQIFRTEGVHGCSVGKVKVGETTGTNFVDSGLRNGFDYFYIVAPVGDDDSCLGPASSCTSVIPVGGANLAFDESSVSVDVLNGDLDPVIDNCEQATVWFDLVNIGNGSLTNIEVVDVQVESHPGSVTVTSSLPSAVSPVLAACGRAPASFSFSAEGLAFNDTLEFRVNATSDELAGRVVSQVIRLPGSETSMEAHSSATFGFESGLEGWQLVQGTFQRNSIGGGAQGSSFHVASSGNLANQCDEIRSPLLRLTPTSTMSMWTNFDIEPSLDIEGFTFWFDRANVGIHHVDSGRRTPVSPDGGRTYNASGSYGTCGTENQEGWADSATTWAESTWSPAALDAGDRAGEFVHLDVRYGTDVEVHGSGFRFDELELTDIELVVNDTQTDVCAVGNTPPVAVADPATAATPAPVTIHVLSNDSDPDFGDSLRVLGVSQPSRGTAVINPAGPDLDTITYFPGDGPGGMDVFQYSVTDGKGGSAIATVTVNRTFIFYSGFESGDASAWSTVVGACEPDGAYTLTSPAAIQYSCCLGLVDINIDQFLFSSDVAQISSAPSDPVPLLGAASTCPAGVFSNSGAIPGSCTEIYALDGSFTGPDTWAGTYTMTFTGPDCDCLDIDPCEDQVFEVTATR
jgi:hypothetical protein